MRKMLSSNNPGESVIKLFTGSLKRNKFRNSQYHKTHELKQKMDSSSLNSGGSSYEEDEEEEDEEEEYKYDSNSKEFNRKENYRSKTRKKSNNFFNLFDDEKAQADFGDSLTNISGNPKKNIIKICESMILCSNSLDYEMQKQISDEINKGKVSCDERKHLRDTEIKDQTKKKERPKSPVTGAGDENKDEDLPEDREFINFGHEKFDLVFNIMLGIKRSIDCLFESPFSKLRDSDYKSKYEYKNEWFSASESSANFFIFYDYAPKIFEDIRTKDGISNQDYIEALGPNNIYNYIWTNDFKSFTQLVSSGKSGSLFYYSMDGKFMLKTIAKEEYNKLIDTLPEYHEHLLENPNSLLTRYYGLHKIRYLEKGGTKEQYIIIMNNMFRNFTPDIKYDLKGSTQGRTTEFKNGKFDPKIALKDNDFTNAKREVNLSPEDKDKLLKIIRKDAEYLGTNSTLDYSLLLGVVDLEKKREEFMKSAKNINETDPVLQIIRDNKDDIEEKSICLSRDKKEVC
jgi:hypothetical protein